MIYFKILHTFLPCTDLNLHCVQTTLWKAFSGRLLSETGCGETVNEADVAGKAEKETWEEIMVQEGPKVYQECNGK